MFRCISWSCELFCCSWCSEPGDPCHSSAALRDSPPEDVQAVLTKVGKVLRKSNVSVDVVSFGECAESNKEVLEAFVAAVNKDSNSHFVEAPPGANLSDFLLSTPVISQGGGDGGGGGEGGGALPPVLHVLSSAGQVWRPPSKLSRVPICLIISGAVHVQISGRCLGLVCQRLAAVG